MTASRAGPPRRGTSPTPPVSTSFAPEPTRCSTRRSAKPSPKALGACALSVVATVVSDSVPGQIVIDAGSKTLAADRDDRDGYGAILGSPATADSRTSTRSTATSMRAATPTLPSIGDRLRIITTHACACINLHDGLLATRAGIAEDVIRVTARGLVR